MSNLSDLLPAGAGAKSASFTASGTLSSGQVVILNTNGTVSSVTETSSSTGTPVNFNSGSSRTYMEPAVVYHPVQDKTVFFFRDSGASNYGKAIVGTVSGTTISFSGATEYTFESGTVGELAAVYDSNIDRIVVVYENSSNYTEAKVVNVSGNTLSFSGASGIGGTTNYEDNSVCFDSSSNKIIFAASSQTNSGYGHARVLTATTSSVSSGTVVTFVSSSVRLGQAVYDANANKTVIAYNRSGARAIVGTVSGTSISFGSEATVSTAGSDSYNVAAAYDSDNNKVVVAYRTALSANDGNANVGTVSGTDITFGSAVQYLSTSADHTAIVYDATAKKMVIAFADGNSNGQLVEGTVSGDSISFTPPTTYQSGSVNDLDKAGAYDSTAGRTVFAYQLDSNKDEYAFVHQAASTDSDKFVGITDEAIANTATGSVVVEGGVTEKVSSLTTGSTYYVLSDGTLADATRKAYDISGASYTSKSFSVSSQESNPNGIAFNTDGTKMLVVGSGGDDVNEYALSTAFDVTTASFTDSFSVATQATTPNGLTFNTDGTAMYVADANTDAIYQYTLTTGFDVSTASYASKSTSISSQDSDPEAVAFNSDGTKMFLLGDQNKKVYEYTVSTGFDLGSTVTYVRDFSVNSQETGPRGLTFNSDGTKMFVVGYQSDTVYQYNLTTGFDLSTASYASISFSVSSEASVPQGITFNATGNNFYVIGSGAVSVFQYDTTTDGGAIEVGKALSTNKLLLKG